MANISAWEPVLLADTITGSQVQRSAIMDAVGTPIPMASDTISVPRFTSSSVGLGCELTDGGNSGDTVAMFGALFNGKETICARDLVVASPGNTNVLARFDQNWMNEFHVQFDNAAIGVSGARSATDSDKRPFTSIYRAVRNADSGVDYTADDNYTTDLLTYDNASLVLQKLEASRFGNKASTVILAHPSLQYDLRQMKDTAGRPIWLNSAGDNVNYETLFGYRVYWTQGAIVSTNMAMTSVTNPLLVAVNTQYLAWGEGSVAPGVPAGPVSRVIPSALNPTSLSDTLVYAASEGFVLTVPQAASVLEVAEPEPETP